MNELKEMQRGEEAKIYEKVKVGNCSCKIAIATVTPNSYGAIMMERC